MKETTDHPSQLPNAPLVEVVFELRWKLQGDESTPKQFWTDPAYPFLSEEFASKVSKYGFKTIRKMGSGGAMLPAYSIGLRFYKDEDQPFPLLQIGPGIFASNESAAYEWESFRKQTLDGIKILLSSYPKVKGFKLTPDYLELRYIDSFDSMLLPSKDVIDFVNKETSLNIKLPAFLTKKPLGKQPKTRFIFESPVASKKDTFFRVEIGNGQAKDKEAILLTSKVISRFENTRTIGKTDKALVKNIGEWLEAAHSLTSSFFKDFVGEALMDKFRIKPNAVE